MNKKTLNRNTVRLYKKGTKGKVGATVRYYPAGKKVVLNPRRNLKGGAIYRVVITTGAKDLAGNRLTKSKVWYFKVRR